ncbi:hypothetical protein BFR04_11150 [Gaetbulibacter sp. 4G1]|nr:hypothetical protein [Gaetbulibacter sp. 4G1]PIA82307.1 hypothetical protein BFR04_11150 [Gaetbulibacter sp. 4G1]
MKNILILVIVFFMLSCKQDRRVEKIKENIVKTEVDTLTVYNNVLNDLIENRLYYRYLGRKWELLFLDLTRNKIDSTAYLKGINTLKDEVVKNDSLKGILYVDGVFDGYKEEIRLLDLAKDNSFDLEEVKLQIKKKNFYAVNSFKSNFVKFKKLRNPDSDKRKDEFEVGGISFSKIVFNEGKDLGIMYFSFVCGEKCGEGSLALIKKVNGKWKVEEINALWKI